MTGAAPLITIFVRHAADCKYAGDEFEKRCRCRKHFRWTKDGKQERRSAGTRSWVEADKIKRRVEDELSGGTTEAQPERVTLAVARDLFIASKETQGLADAYLGKFRVELERFIKFSEARLAYAVPSVDITLMLAYQKTWMETYPASSTRAFVRKRLNMFLRFCHQNGWLARVPKTPAIRISEPPTLPLAPEEFETLLSVVRTRKIKAVILLMRWSGLSVRDAGMLRRDALIERDKVWHIVTSRQKTGMHVWVPLPATVAKTLLDVEGGDSEHFFYSGPTDPTIFSNALSHTIADAFTRAGIESGHMKSHRLRDTFAVHLLEKGVPLESVSKLLGHDSVRTTELHYAKWSRGRQDMLDALVVGTW